MAENMPMLVIGIIVVVLITAGLTYYIAKSGGNGIPGNYTNQSGKPTITVSGEATKTVMPDQLTLGITVTGNGTTVADSQADAAAKVAAMKAALIAQGVSEGDIQTTSFYTSPVYNGSCYNCYPRPIYYAADSGAAQGAPTPAAEPAPSSSGSSGSGASGSGGIAVPPSSVNDASIYPVPPYPYCDYNKCTAIGYQTVHMISVKTNQTSSGGKLLDAATSVNGTRFDYVYFSLKDSTRISLESELQGEAAAAAKAKAVNIAGGVGAKLGKIVSINPQQNYPYPVYAGKGTASPGTTDSSAPPTEIFPSETTLYSSIVVVYELEQ